MVYFYLFTKRGWSHWLPSFLQTAVSMIMFSWRKVIKRLGQTGPPSIRVKAWSAKRGPCPDAISWFMSGLSLSLVQFCEKICPDYRIWPRLGSFYFHFWPWQCLNLKIFRHYATFVRTMHPAFQAPKSSHSSRSLSLTDKSVMIKM